MLSGRHASAASAAHLIRALAWTARTCDVHIAAVRPMSGSSDASGALMRDYAAAAVETLNGSGLLADTKVTSSIADGACDPRQAVAVANKLTTDQARRVAGHCAPLRRFRAPTSSTKRASFKGHQARQILS
ncbi:ABC transporter substrate-binding protein [Bradyrhizobium sp. B124]|uniref:ABC transporter substrate-binding protein n=1 Tax=Bradyrhizobium sp. B124 TaxID=3140245 RepID=UPI003182D2AA